MPRGGHRNGTKWEGAPKTDTVRVPVEIKAEVHAFALKLWEDKRRDKDESAKDS